MSVVYRTYEGRRYSPIFWEAVCEWRRLAQAEGIPFNITQGGHNNGAVAASGGTHDGDAIDLSVRGLTEKQVARLIELGRMVGIAVWFRTTSVAKWGTRAQGFGSYHAHGVPNGWGHPSAGAARQAMRYREGKDGLARNLADLGPGHVSTYRTRTWAGYKASLKTSTPSTDTETHMTPEQEARIIAAIKSNSAAGLTATANGQRKTLYEIAARDHVLAEAQSAALLRLDARIANLARQYSDSADADYDALVADIVSGIAGLVDDAVRETVSGAGADETAQKVVKLLLDKVAVLATAA